MDSRGSPLKKIIFISLFFISGIVKAGGPLYRNKDVVSQQEFDNVYQNLANITVASGTYIFNQNSLQSGSTAYPQYFYVGSTPTLSVNATANRVGINTTSPLKVLDIRGASDGLLLLTPTDDANLTNDIFQITNAGFSNKLSVSKNGNIYAATGTIAFPGHSFIGDTNTGMGTTAADVLSLSAGGIQMASFTITGSNLVGTTTNDSAATGYVGEAVRSYVSSYTNFPTTSQYGDLTSISLTAGDWDVSANMTAIIGTSNMTAWRMGITSTSGNSGTGFNDGDNTAFAYPPTAIIAVSACVPVFRVSISATTTYYLKYFATYASGNPQATGRISARRVR